jgi:hypothetical protein
MALLELYTRMAASFLDEQHSQSLIPAELCTIDRQNASGGMGNEMTNDSMTAPRAETDTECHYGIVAFIVWTASARMRARRWFSSAESSDWRMNHS